MAAALGTGSSWPGIPNSWRSASTDSDSGTEGRRGERKRDMVSNQGANRAKTGLSIYG